MTDKITAWAAKLQSIAQAGLFYGKDDFDKERYEQVRAIAAEMLAERSGLPLQDVKERFCAESGYQTPKVDTRAAVFKDGRILLVRERSGGWALPGGWCEFDLSPAENTVKEAKEEAGVDVRVKRLIAVQDRAKHNQPPYVFAVIKIFYLCEALGGAFAPNIETTASGWFAKDALPPLAEGKCSLEQVMTCFAASEDPLWTAQFD